MRPGSEGDIYPSLHCEDRIVRKTTKVAGEDHHCPLRLLLPDPTLLLYWERMGVPLLCLPAWRDAFLPTGKSLPVGPLFCACYASILEKVVTYRTEDCERKFGKERRRKTGPIPERRLRPDCGPEPV